MATKAVLQIPAGNTVPGTNISLPGPAPTLLAPAGSHWRVGLRYSCPSATENKGGPLTRHETDLHQYVSLMEKMQEFVQDALDAIEYANGPAASTWGAMRAKNGHSAPFHLKYMEIGNENGGPAYHERYGLFYDAIKSKYPGMHLIANEWSGSPDNRPVEIVDEHYYSTPEFFINHAGKYDAYDRAGRKVYVGEYAVTQGCGQGNLRAAVGEAAFMTGLERNSDVVVMASYAPLLVNLNHRAWNPDLINFDSSRWYGLPSYYVQKLFAENRGSSRSRLTAAVAVSTLYLLLGR